MKYVVGLGSNLGDREAMLKSATRAIGEIAPIDRASRVYETAPIGPAQPTYLNAAVLITAGHDAHSLLAELHAIERRLGRTRSASDARWGPRTIDIDILWADTLVIDSPTLVVPHPRLIERAFAVAPLLDVAPNAKDPRTGLQYAIPLGEIAARSDMCIMQLRPR